MPKKEYITKEYLDKTLDKKFDALAIKIAKGFEATANKVDMDSKFTGIDNKFTGIDNKFTGIDNKFVIISKNINSLQVSLEKKIDNTKDELKADINNVQTLIDGYVKAQEDFKIEFIIIKEEVKQIKEVLKKKFKIEIKAL